MEEEKRGVGEGRWEGKEGRGGGEKEEKGGGGVGDDDVVLLANMTS